MNLNWKTVITKTINIIMIDWAPALPISRPLKPSIYALKTSVLVSPLGAPIVVVSIIPSVSKKEYVILIIIKKKVVGINKGKVIVQNLLKLLLQSIMDASMMDF